MKKRVFIFILIVIAVLGLIAGCCIHIFGMLKNRLGDTSIFNAEGVSSENMITEEKELSDFSSISITGSVMNITIEKGVKNGISYSYTEKSLIPDIEVKNQTLTVEQPETKEKYHIQTQCSVVITVEEGTDLTDCVINSSVGNVCLSDLCIGKTDIDISTGDIKLSNTSFIQLNIEDNVGSVDLEGCGELTDYQMDISTNMGSIEVNNEDRGDEYTKEGKEDYCVMIQNNVGSVSITE